MENLYLCGCNCTTYPNMHTYNKDTIKDLLAKGHLREALEILAEVSVEGEILLSRYSRLSREKRLGTISHDTSSIEINRIQSAALDIILEINFYDNVENNGRKPVVLNQHADSINHNTISLDKEKRSISKWTYPFRWVKDRMTNKQKNNPSGPIIYILSHQKDSYEVEDIKKQLGSAGFTNIIDHSDPQIGEKLSTFANHNLLNPEFVIVLVSRSSLKFGWDGLERYSDLVSNALVHPHCMVLTLDRDYEKPNFIADFSEKIEVELDALYSQKSDGAISQKILALNNQRNHLARIVQRLRQTEPIDYSLEHIKKLVEHIKSIVESKAAKSKTLIAP